MADDSNLLYSLKLRLRRKYAADLPGLKTLSDAVFAEATETVTITQLTFESGQGSGTITCPRDIYLRAIEEVIIELDVDAPRPSNAAVCYFR